MLARQTIKVDLKGLDLGTKAMMYEASQALCCGVHALSCSLRAFSIAFHLRFSSIICIIQRYDIKARATQAIV